MNLLPDHGRPSGSESSMAEGVRCERLRFFLSVIRDAVREIFDEGAYSRYLVTHGIENSSEAYKGFLVERERGSNRLRRCC